MASDSFAREIINDLAVKLRLHELLTLLYDGHCDSEKNVRISCVRNIKTWRAKVHFPRSDELVSQFVRPGLGNLLDTVSDPCLLFKILLEDDLLVSLVKKFPRLDAKHIREAVNQSFPVLRIAERSEQCFVADDGGVVNNGEINDIPESNPPQFRAIRSSLVIIRLRRDITADDLVELRYDIIDLLVGRRKLRPRELLARLAHLEITGGRRSRAKLRHGPCEKQTISVGFSLDTDP